MSGADLIPLVRREFWFTAVRSRGLGGQNVNKVSSAAVLYWAFCDSPILRDDQKAAVRLKLAGFINSDQQIYVRSDEFRDLARNKARCEEKLGLLLERALHRARARKPSQPTRGSKLRKKETKSRRADIKKSRQKVL